MVAPINNPGTTVKVIPTSPNGIFFGSGNNAPVDDVVAVRT